MSTEKQSTEIESEEPVQVGNYVLEQIIGKGSYGKVRLGIHKETKDKVYKPSIMLIKDLINSFLPLI
jgi:hypothetical protein